MSVLRLGAVAGGRRLGLLASIQGLLLSLGPGCRSPGSPVVLQQRLSAEDSARHMSLRPYAAEAATAV